MIVVRNNSAQRRYLRRTIPITVAYVGAVWLASALVDDRSTISPLAVGIALLPGIAVIGWIWAIGRLLIELDDEYLRMLEVRKTIIATGVTLAVTSIWGLLEFYTSVPKLPVFWVFPMWCIGLIIGQIANRVTTGDGGCP
jgi:hypothetical protein